MEEPSPGSRNLCAKEERRGRRETKILDTSSQGQVSGETEHGKFEVLLRVLPLRIYINTSPSLLDDMSVLKTLSILYDLPYFYKMATKPHHSHTRLPQTGIITLTRMKRTPRKQVSTGPECFEKFAVGRRLLWHQKTKVWF